MGPESRGQRADAVQPAAPGKKSKLGAFSGVYIPVFLNILSIIMFLRFGSILGRVGLIGMAALLAIAYGVTFLTILSLSAIASNGEVKGGGPYYMISRSLGPEFGGSIGILFYLSMVMNTSLNIVGLIDSLKLNLFDSLQLGYWQGYAMQTAALVLVTLLSLAGKAFFFRASNTFLVILMISTLSIPFSMVFKRPFHDMDIGVHFTGPSLHTLRSNLLPHGGSPGFKGFQTLRDLFGVLFPATSGIFAGASMSNDLRNPSKSIPRGTLWATFSTMILYLILMVSIASSVTRPSLVGHSNVVFATSLWPPLVLVGECAITFFSALIGMVTSAGLIRAVARDRLLFGLNFLEKGTWPGDSPLYAILSTYAIAQLALFANLNQIATLISMGFQMTFFVMNLACFLLKIGSAPNFRPGFKFFTWQSAFLGVLLSGAAMFLIDETYAAIAICILIFLFLLIHFMSPPKHWGDVSQNLIYHQVRKYLLRLKPEHIKFWRPQIILIINDPRHNTRLIQFCNSLKKGSLYILGHVIVTSDFSSGVNEAKLQQAAWTKYISEYSRIKAFVQLTMSPSIEWGIRNLILSAGLGGMRPNIAVLGFYNMDDLRRSRPLARIPSMPTSPIQTRLQPKIEGKPRRPSGRPRGDTSARLLEGFLPTDTIKTEGMMSTKSYMTILEDLALRHRLNVAIGKGFHDLESTRAQGPNKKKYVDLWPIQMSAEIQAGDKNILTTNFDTYTLILQLGYILLTVPAWKKVYKLRVLVFVEYESEVEDERRRLKALLEKLRIDARILVFCLASGEQSAYEHIVNGNTKDQQTANLVDDILADEEWWHDLKRLRNEAQELSRSQELARLEEMLGSHHRRGSSPHTTGHRPEGDGEPTLRPDIQQFLDNHKKPTVSTMSKLGANFGIRTHQLDTAVFDQTSDRDSDISSDDEVSSSSSSDIDFNHEADRTSRILSPLRRRLFPLTTQNPREEYSRLEEPQEQAIAQQSILHAPDTSSRSYGTVAAPYIQDSADDRRKRGSRRTTGESTRQNSGNTTDNPSEAASGAPGKTTPPYGAKPPSRPPLTRGSSTGRFSSKPMPETQVTTEHGAEPTITFSQAETSTAPPRPPLSRTPSVGVFSSRPTPLTKVDSGEDTGPRITFVEPEPSQPPTPMIRSRQNSASFRTAGGGMGDSQDLHLSVPQILESYRAMDPGAGADKTKYNDGYDGYDGYDGTGGSSYSTQSLPLSFNELPSRAQHLIINELIKRNSGSDTAVVLTTLPVPEEGTCEDEEASLRYLSDIEVLCHELPPVLLVLSNNMTVTVSL